MVYKWCKQAVILVGGLGGIQGAERSEYMNRAWTLEECTLNQNNGTWVLIDWDYDTEFKVTRSPRRPLHVNLDSIGGYSKVEFRILLKFPRRLGRHTNSPYIPYELRTKCLDGTERRVAKIVKSTLMDYYSMYKKSRLGAREGKETAILRSMLLRTPSNVKDVIYSVQGKLDL